MRSINMRLERRAKWEMGKDRGGVGEMDRLHQRICLSLTSSHSVEEASNQCFAKEMLGGGWSAGIHTHSILQVELCLYVRERVREGVCVYVCV